MANPATTNEPTGGGMSFLGHLDELRRRLTRALIGIAIATAVALYYSEAIIAFLTRPAVASGNVKLTLLAPAEGFLTHLKASFVAGLFLSSPYWLGQVWGFISPGLYAREKKTIVPVIALSVVAFVGGAAFGWTVLPFATEYFASFATGPIEAGWSLASYVSFNLQFLLAFGVVFELPLIIYAAAMIGAVTPPQLRQYRRHSIIGILIVAGIITPPDVFSQLLIAGPLIILYEVGIITSSIALKRRARREAART
ncbi:MAG: twin-arginine translocase subunit TatC [Calditrichaeota bacterium]|nr:twin-arginine translocase subunit TatC [Calditrichota bacterium]